MKTVFLALCVLLVVSQGEALRCSCRGLRFCPNPIETCRRPEHVCASVQIYAGTPGWFKGCMSEIPCRKMDRPGISSSRCCKTDMCNVV